MLWKTCIYVCLGIHHCRHRHELAGVVWAELMAANAVANGFKTRRYT